MEFVKALGEINRKSQERISRLSTELEHLIQIVKNKMRSSRIEVQEVDSIGENTESDVSIVAIDSSCDVIYEDFLGRNIYAIVAQAVSYIPLKGYKGVDDFVQYIEDVDIFEEETDVKTFLSSIALCIELIMASKLSNSHKIVLMDGSVVTFISKINQIMQISRRYPRLTIARWIQSNYANVLRSLFHLLTTSFTVFIPKKSSRKEFLSSLDMQTSPYTDFEVLYMLLNKGEFVVVPIQKFDYNLPPVENIPIQDIFDTINRGWVIYLKTFHNRVYKIEVFPTFHYNPSAISVSIPLPLRRMLNSIYQIFTIDGENILTYEADKSAKNKLQILKENCPIQNIWRCRV